MSYNKTLWTDDVVENDVVVSKGTPLNAEHFNNIENGIESAVELAENVEYDLGQLQNKVNSNKEDIDTLKDVDTGIEHTLNRLAEKDSTILDIVNETIEDTDTRLNEIYEDMDIRLNAISEVTTQVEEVTGGSSNLKASLNSTYAPLDEFNNMKDQIAQNKPIVISDDVPVGTVIWYHSTAINNIDSSVWMVCDGRTLPIDDYPELYEIWGSRWAMEGDTTFEIPNLGANAVIRSVDPVYIDDTFLHLRDQQFASGSTTDITTIALVPLVKVKQRAKDMTTVSQEWTQFKDNGGSIGGSVVAEGGGSYASVEAHNTSSGVRAQMCSWETGGVSIVGISESDQPVTEQIYLQEDGVFFGGCNKNPNGYTVLNNGMLYQWGVCTVEVSRGSSVTIDVRFPVSFPNEIVTQSVTCTNNSTTNSIAWTSAIGTSMRTSDLHSAIIEVRDIGNSLPATYTFEFKYNILGY